MIDVPAREPGPGEVRLAVRAAGVNPVDDKLYRGEFGTDQAHLPLREAAAAHREIMAGHTTGKIILLP